MTPQMILIKDVEGPHLSEPIHFVEAVAESLRCALCENVSPEIKEDSHGHIYCISCLNMIQDGGKFECEKDRNVEDVNEMRQSPSTWNKVLQLVVKCPNQKSGCRFQASVEEFLLHLQTCQADTRKPCAFCGERIESKQHASHVLESCPKRPLNCPYCCEGIEACDLDNHLEVCDHRPEDCRHCGEPFDTFKELRDVHLPECPQKQINCPYKPLGCDYQGPRQEIVAHAQNGVHIDILVKRFNELSVDLQEERKKNAKLEKRIQQLEDRQLEEDQYRLDIEDNIDQHASTIQNLKNEVEKLKTEPVERTRVDELQRSFDTYHAPFERLLNGLRDVALE
ncbi:unnamed protein product [Ixodes hexagonus]